MLLIVIGHMHGEEQEQQEGAAGHGACYPLADSLACGLNGFQGVNWTIERQYPSAS